MYQFQGRQPDEKIIQNVYLFIFFFFLNAVCIDKLQILKSKTYWKVFFFFLKLYFYKYRITKKKYQSYSCK